MNFELKQRNQELSNKYSASLDENEQFQKMIVTLKANVEVLETKNEYIRDEMKYYQNEFELAEFRITDLNIKTMDYESIVSELLQEKVQPS